MDDDKKVELHVVDLAFARFAALYVDNESSIEGISLENLEFYASERDSHVVKVSPELGRYAFYLARKYQLANRNAPDLRDMIAHAVCSNIRSDFIASGFPGPV